MEKPITTDRLFGKIYSILKEKGKLPITEGVSQCFWTIIEDREGPKCERVVDGYAGSLFFTDKNGYPEVAMHWEHRFNHMVKGTMIFTWCRYRISCPCLPQYLLQQYGKVRHEPQDTPMPDGA